VGKTGKRLSWVGKGGMLEKLNKRRPKKGFNVTLFFLLNAISIYVVYIFPRRVFAAKRQTTPAALWDAMRVM